MQIIYVYSLPEVKLHEQSQSWEIVLWLGDAFDFSIPFRAILTEICKRLDEKSQTELSLPEYVQNEDFVSGRLVWGAADLAV